MSKQDTDNQAGSYSENQPNPAEGQNVTEGTEASNDTTEGGEGTDTAGESTQEGGEAKGEGQEQA